MKLNLETILSPIRYAYQNPGKTSLRALQLTIAGGVLYVACKTGREAYKSSKSVVCSCHGDAVSLALNLLEITALCLSSVVIAKYNHFKVKPLPKLPEGSSNR